MPDASFQVFLPATLAGEPGSAPDLDVLGLWQIRAGDAPGGTVWRADLPAEPLRAQAALAQHDRSLRLAGRALAAAPARLVTDLRQLTQAGAPRQLAYDPQAQPAETSAVLQRALLYRLDAPSFGDLVDEAEVAQVTRLAGQFMALMQRQAGQQTLVETVTAGRTRAITRVAWNSEIITWITPAGGPERGRETEWARGHQALLAQALATRQAWLRFLLLFSGSMVKVGAALAAPAFFPLTLWTTWTYLRSLVAEYHRLEQALAG